MQKGHLEFLHTDWRDQRMADPERSETMAVVPKFRPTFDIIPNRWGFFTWRHMVGAKCIKCVRMCTTLGWVSKDRWLIKLIYYPLSIIITFTYTIPLVELTQTVRTPHKEISTFPITIGIRHVRYKFQGRLSNNKIVKAVRRWDLLGLVIVKELVEGKSPTISTHLSPQHFNPINILQAFGAIWQTEIPIWFANRRWISLRGNLNLAMKAASKKLVSFVSLL